MKKIIYVVLILVSINIVAQNKNNYFKKNTEIQGLYPRVDSIFVPIEYIPLLGTEYQKPLSGNIEILNDGTNKSLFCISGRSDRHLTFTDNGLLVIKNRDVSNNIYSNIEISGNSLELKTNDENTGEYGTLKVFTDKISIISSTPGFKGLVGDHNYQSTYTANSYVQKSYVDGKTVNNATTVMLTLAQLNMQYLGVMMGFRVQCINIITGSIIYEKTGTGWVSTTVNIVN